MQERLTQRRNGATHWKNLGAMERLTQRRNGTTHWKNLGEMERLTQRRNGATRLKRRDERNRSALTIVSLCVASLRRCVRPALPLVLLGLLVQGCGTRLPSLQKRTELPPGSVCRVAVLPFVNESDYHLGQEIAYKVFATEFTRLGSYLSASEGDIGKIYRQMGIYPGQMPSTEQLGVLGDRLGARLLITGKVLEMRENPGEHGTTNPVLALSIRIHDGRSGDALWTAYHRRQGTDYRKVMHFGKIHTITGLGQQVAAEIVNLWFEQGLTACDAPPRL